jgi:hypothetical protein
MGCFGLWPAGSMASYADAPVGFVEMLRFDVSRARQLYVPFTWHPVRLNCF